MLNVIRAALAAGLYPNVVNVRKPRGRYQEVASGAFKAADKAKELSFYLEGRERVWLHPSSVNFSEGVYDSPWMVYNEIAKTSRVSQAFLYLSSFLRDEISTLLSTCRRLDSALAVASLDAISFTMNISMFRICNKLYITYLLDVS